MSEYPVYGPDHKEITRLKTLTMSVCLITHIPTICFTIRLVLELIRKENREQLEPNDT